MHFRKSLLTFCSKMDVFWLNGQISKCILFSDFGPTVNWHLTVRVWKVAQILVIFPDSLLVGLPPSDGPHFCEQIEVKSPNWTTKKLLTLDLWNYVRVIFRPPKKEFRGPGNNFWMNFCLFSQLVAAEPPEVVGDDFFGDKNNLWIIKKVYLTFFL